MTTSATSVRHFACTGCGQCCDNGPDIELSEATALADCFVTSLLFRVVNLPASDRAGWARDWWQAQRSGIPLGAALEENRRAVAAFASRKTIDKDRERHRYLIIGAMAHDFGARRCPQLHGQHCGIYDRRPLTCRTVPLHYSRPASGLAAYLDDFVATPGYQCATSDDAPALIKGRAILAADLRASRDAATRVAHADRA